ncbi:hypothetical protein ACQCP0_05855 [Ralstonia pseudosolanacearum]|uniref:Uncharacterized protein n=1 Tax=Ralstonia solanacearum TaxID=305 RepID=A0A0S4X2E4_RALSL|nr:MULTISPECIES: hypothetical protein [Ralstonia]APF87797.1 hypothetical protein BCR16_13790 [Ralstonia solanacearum FJAT-1458]ARS55452.1 hypothetical protein BC427_04595 [Ralstonia solanacearum FJAT-91]AVV67842.1 hypothetical protein RSOE_12460 [Ralstonia solanacearum OE1-1]AXV96441.1 hypothetical protein CJO80_13185 [Ralstonia solanacearum]API75425.1 hypothetical protein AC251_13190 [Ralstonia pseudosolanacearum]
MDDLDTLIPQPAELVVGGEALAIEPLKVGRLPAFLRAISPTLQQLNAPSIDWLGLFIEHGDDLLQAVAIAVDKPRVWVDALAADEAILLAAKVVEVNADFFTRTVLPRLDGLFAHVTQAAASGSTPSSA